MRKPKVYSKRNPLECVGTNTQVCITCAEEAETAARLKFVLTVMPAPRYAKVLPFIKPVAVNAT